MSEVVERVALAIHEAMDIADGLDLQSAEKYARAAIAAMREPSEAMTEAHHDASWSFPDTWRETAVVAWQSMIDAALSE